MSKLHSSNSVQSRSANGDQEKNIITLYQNMRTFACGSARKGGFGVRLMASGQLEEEVTDGLIHRTV